jgi:hypothetical protein
MQKSYGKLAALFMGVVLQAGVFAGAPAYADEAAPVQPAPAAGSSGDSAFDHTFVFGGIDGGLSRIFSTSTSESLKSGYNFAIKGVAAVYRKDWVYDLGVGYFTNNMQSPGGAVTVLTNGGFVELSPRYRITPQWQIGPVVNIAFSSDMSFSEQISGPDQTTFQLQGGIRGQYELAVSNFIVRLGVQALTNATSTKRQVGFLEGDVQFGFPVGTVKDLPF